MGNISRTHLLAFAALFVAVWVGLAIWAFSSAGPAPDTGDKADAQAQAKNEAKNVSRDPEEPSGNKPGPTLPIIEATPTFDTSDPRKLIGFSENVFVAKVESKVSEVPLKSTIPNSDGNPQVQFEVTVGETIKSGGQDPVKKGNTAVVDQMGGTDPATKLPFTIQVTTGGESYTDTILKPGNEYLFATRHDRIRGFQTIVAQPHGNMLITGDPAGEATVEVYKRSLKDQVNPLNEVSDEGGGQGQESVAKGGAG